MTVKFGSSSSSRPVDKESRAQKPVLYRRLLGERGANLMEYVLLVSLIAVLCIAAMQAFRQRNTDLFLLVASQLP